jgi:uncharacterized SAM-binding protein YcdF (DUF218 family)
MICVACAIVAMLVVSAVFFVWPSQDRWAPAQAVVVLGGSGPRVQLGEAIVRAGYSHVLVVSTPSPDAQCPSPISDVRIICFAPDPSTTRGEAEFTRRLAEEHQWSKIIVVASTPQVTRARIRFRRCLPKATLLMESVSPGDVVSWIDDVIYEWGAMVKAEVWQRAC